MSEEGNGKPLSSNPTHGGGPRRRASSRTPGDCVSDVSWLLGMVDRQSDHQHCFFLEGVVDRLAELRG